MCVWVGVHGCMDGIMHTYACMHTCMYTGMHACNDAFMNAYMHVCIGACMREYVNVQMCDSVNG